MRAAQAKHKLVGSSMNQVGDHPQTRHTTAPGVVPGVLGACGKRGQNGSGQQYQTRSSERGS